MLRPATAMVLPSPQRPRSAMPQSSNALRGTSRWLHEDAANRTAKRNEAIARKLLAIDHVASSPRGKAVEPMTRADVEDLGHYFLEKHAEQREHTTSARESKQTAIDENARRTTQRRLSAAERAEFLKRLVGHAEQQQQALESKRELKLEQSRQAASSHHPRLTSAAHAEVVSRFAGYASQRKAREQASNEARTAQLRHEARAKRVLGTDEQSAMIQRLLGYSTQKRDRIREAEEQLLANAKQLASSRHSAKLEAAKAARVREEAAESEGAAAEKAERDAATKLQAVARGHAARARR